jgi:alpha-beta hydrolase superfamily lysophospholipase
VTSNATPVRRIEGHFAASGGRELFGRAWIPYEPRASILLVHGLAEHCGRYEHVGRWLAGHGFAVHAYDHQGHGLSDGVRCYVRRFSDFLDDAAVALERVRAAEPERPVFVVGHSMGGLVVAALACERQPDVAGFVTSAAALVPGAPPPAIQLALLRLARRVLPRLHISNNLDPDGLSTDPEVGRRYLDDPLVERKLTLSLASELFAQMKRTAASGEAVGRPLLCMHGDDDPICAAEGSRAFAAAAPHARYRGFPGMRHEIFNEPRREAVFETMLSWLDEVCAKQ